MLWRCIVLPLAATVVVAVLVTNPTSAAAQTAAPTSTVSTDAPPTGGTSGGLGNILPDPSKWLVDALSGTLASLGRTILQAAQRDVDWALGQSDGGTDFVTRTPPAHSYQSPSVRWLFDTVRQVADLALGLVAMWAGYQVMSGSQVRNANSVHSAMDFAPRIVLGAVLVNTSLWWAQLAIDSSNALGGLAGPIVLPGKDAATDPPLVLELVLAGLVYWLVALLLVLQQLMRLALIDVLLVLAPLGMLLWILPQTQAWGRLWSDLFLSTVFAQPVQMLVLKLGTLLVGELDAGGPLVSLFLAIGIGYVVLKVPGMIRSGLVRGGGGMGGVGIAAATVGVRQLGRTAGVSR